MLSPVLGAGLLLLTCHGVRSGLPPPAEARLGGRYTLVVAPDRRSPPHTRAGEREGGKERGRKKGGRVSTRPVTFNKEPVGPSTLSVSDERRRTR